LLWLTVYVYQCLIHVPAETRVRQSEKPCLRRMEECRLYWNVTELGKDGYERLTALHFMTSVKQSLYRALGLQEVEAPRIVTESAHESGMVVSPEHRPPLPPGSILDTHFCYRLSRPQDHSAAGRIKSTINPDDATGNRTRNLPACTAVFMASVPVYFSYIRLK
jgi:hypothetical protein